MDFDRLLFLTSCTKSTLLLITLSTQRQQQIRLGSSLEDINSWEIERQNENRKPNEGHEGQRA